MSLIIGILINFLVDGCDLICFALCNLQLLFAANSNKYYL